jgi:hypothetical protein
MMGKEELQIHSANGRNAKRENQCMKNDFKNKI